MKFDKFNLSLNDMEKETYNYKTPYVNKINTDYTYTFSSGHKLTIFQGALDNYMLNFKSPNGKSGEMGNDLDPEELLNKFLYMLNNNDIRNDLMVGFEF